MAPPQRLGPFSRSCATRSSSTLPAPKTMTPARRWSCCQVRWARFACNCRARRWHQSMPCFVVLTTTPPPCRDLLQLRRHCHRRHCHHHNHQWPQAKRRPLLRPTMVHARTQQTAYWLPTTPSARCTGKPATARLQCACILKACSPIGGSLPKKTTRVKKPLHPSSPTTNAAPLQ